MKKYKSEIVIVFIGVWQIFNALGIYPETGFWLAFVVTIGVVVLVSNLERAIQFFQEWRTICDIAVVTSLLLAGVGMVYYTNIGIVLIPFYAIAVGYVIKRTMNITDKSTYVIEPADPPIFITPPESKE